MQQTSIDRWLRKKFIYYTHVYCNTLPREVPGGVQVEETTRETGGRFLYRLTTGNETLLREISKCLEKENITYTSRVAERKGLAGRLFNNPLKSFTYQVAWIIFILFIISIIVSGLPVYIWKTYTQPIEEETKEAKIEMKETNTLLTHAPSTLPFYRI